MDRRDLAILAKAVDAGYALLVDFPVREALSSGDDDAVVVKTPLGTALSDAQALYDRIKNARNKKKPTLTISDKVQRLIVDAHDAVYGATVNACNALTHALSYGLNNPKSHFSLVVVSVAILAVLLLQNSAPGNLERGDGRAADAPQLHHS